MHDPVPLLESCPSYDDLITTLKEWTEVPVFFRDTISTSAAIVTHILPHYWEPAHQDEELKALIVSSLASVHGVKFILREKNKEYCLSLLQDVLKSRQFRLSTVLDGLHNLDAREDSSSKSGLSKSGPLISYLNLIPRGSIVGIVAERLASERNDIDAEAIWLVDRHRFSVYLSNQCGDAIKSLASNAGQKCYEYLGQYLDCAMSFGGTQQVLAPLIDSLLKYPDLAVNLGLVYRNLPQQRQVRVFEATAQYIQDNFLTATSDRSSVESLDREVDRIGAASTFFSQLADTRLSLYFEHLLLRTLRNYTLSMRRAILVAYEKSQLMILAEKCLALWAEKDLIQNSSVKEQEVHTETLLVICAYLTAGDLLVLSKSRAFTEGISNHLESTSDRVRFLGMILGEAVSAQVIGDEKKRLTFGVPDTQSTEAQWWRALIEIEDEFKDLSLLSAGLVDLPRDSGVLAMPSKKDALDITEVLDLEESSDEEFPSMRVPDSDDEDSDEDPTLVDREKLRPPVYIRDLIQMINNHDSYKHVSLALRTGPSLIRRKANYGSELSDYAINLVQIFAGLRDNFDMDEFQELRQECLKALVVSCPTISCPYLAETFFKGDYSLQQRVMILSAMALGSRELAGADDIAPQFKTLTISKTLPQKVLRQYQSIDTMTASIQAKILQPMAHEAIDEVSGPAALKVQKTTRKVRTRPQSIASNKLTPVAAEYILLPLLNRFSKYGGKMIDADAKTFYEASLLAYYIRTISIIYQVSGRSPQLGQLTLDFWALLLSLRAQSDHSVLEAILLSLLILIDTNEGTRLASDFSHHLLETQQWCTVLFRVTRGETVKMLCAAVFLRVQNIVEEHQMLMMQRATTTGGLGSGRFGIAGLK